MAMKWAKAILGMLKEFTHYSLGHLCPGEYSFRLSWWMSDRR